MLKSLRITNFVLIDHLELDWSSGFTTITGETGSGKSILVHALNLLLGERADFKVIGPKSDKAVCEAEFDIDVEYFRSLFVEAELDIYPVLILRREIATNGRSRAFVNDTPVQLNVLRTISEKLISIHSQYNTLELRDRLYQLELLDVLANCWSERTAFQSKYSNYLQINRELEALRKSAFEANRDKDYLQFMVDELEPLQLDRINYDEIENKLNIALNQDDRKLAFEQLAHAIQGEECILEMLQKSKNNLAKLNSDETADQFGQRLQSVIMELKDIAAVAEDELEKNELNPEELAQLQLQIDQFNTVLSKHRCADQRELLSIRDEMQAKLSNAGDLSDAISTLEQKANAALTELKQEAETLHKARLEATRSIEGELINILKELKLASTKTEIQLSKGEMSATGISQVQFLFSANEGMPLVPIEKAASGGELSRVMLALQKMKAERMKLPTILFDEIDTGVSGDVAQKIGDLLKNMGNHAQLVAITHLPQVAAKGHQQLLVAKHSDQGRTISEIRVLSNEERVAEIARLMSGEVITEAALSNAKELMAS